MCAKRLPSRPSFTHLKNQAKQLLRAVRSGDTSAYVRCRDAISRFSALTDEDLAGAAIALQDCQLVVAREHGFEGWWQLKDYLESHTVDWQDPVQALLASVAYGDTEKVRQLLEEDSTLANTAGSGVPVWEPGQFLPLQLAILRDRSDVAEILLDRGADVNAKCDGWNALAHALAGNKPELSELLSRRGAVVDIHCAVLLDDAARVKELLQGDPHLVHDRGARGVTPLHSVKSVAVAQLLIDHGADVEAQTKGGQRVLERYPDQQQIADLLILNGAVVDIYVAVRRGDLDTVRDLLDQDRQLVNGTGRRDAPPVLGAKSREMVQLLLECGADIDARVPMHGHTLLDRAIWDEDSEMVAFLSERATIDIITAVELNDIDKVRQFLEDDPGLANAHRGGIGTPLHHARGNADMIRLLLEHGADPNARMAPCDGGYTVLQWATWSRDPDTIRLLVEAGADMTVTDTLHNRTASQWASEWLGWEEGVKLLRELGDQS